MREYQVRRTEDCPTGEHVHLDDDPDDPTRQIATTVDCSCPWLVIRESRPVPHMMVWSTRESVQRLIREFDRGHFDQEGMPRRKSSQFMSPHVSDLLNLIDAKDTVGAAMRLLATVTADQVRWLPERSTLAIRIPFGHGQTERTTMETWLQLTFEPGEPIRVDRGPLPDSAAEGGRLDLTVGGRESLQVGGLDLAALAEIVDGRADRGHWQLWRTQLNRDQVTSVALSAQAIGALVDVGGWEAAPPPADSEGYHDPMAEAAREQLIADVANGTALCEGGEDRFSGVLARGEVVELRVTPEGIEATSVFPGEVADLVGDQRQQLATGGIVTHNPLIEVPLPQRVPGTVHGIRPHKEHTRAEHDAARTAALDLAARPLAAHTAESLRRFAEGTQQCVQIPCPPFSSDDTPEPTP